MSTISVIRNTAVSILQEANVASGRVFNSKVTPTFLKNTPSVLIYTDKVQAEQFSATKPVFVATVAFQIDIVVSMTETWADEADDLVAEVINTLMANEAWVALFTAIDGYQVSYSFIGDMQSPLATASITVVGKVFNAF